MLCKMPSLTIVKDCGGCILALRVVPIVLVGAVKRRAEKGA